MLKLGLAAAAMMMGAAAPAFAPDGGPDRPAYAEGQIWEYRTRGEDEGSLLKIQRIERHPNFAERGPVYHISLSGLRIPGLAGGGVVPHLPVSRATLDSSVTRLSDRGADFPDPEEGIAMWREAQGGVFDRPVAEIVEFVEETVRRALEAAGRR